MLGTYTRHPQNRYYTQPSDHHSQSPESLNTMRYSRFKGLPINIDSNIIYPQAYNPYDYMPQISQKRSHSLQHSQFLNNASAKNRMDEYEPLKNSIIYQKPGRHHRNQLGWDGVKLSEYVLNNLSGDYDSNAKMLDKFKREAEENRKKKMHSHLRHNSTKERLPIIHQTAPRKNINSQLSNHSELMQSNWHQSKAVQAQPMKERVYVRNVAVNTNKKYEIDQLQKYVALQDKYYRLKEKYKKYKHSTRRKPKRIKTELNPHYSPLQSSRMTDLQHKLNTISLQLNQNNQALSKMIGGNTKNLQEELQSCQTEEQENLEEYLANEDNQKEVKSSPSVQQKQSTRTEQPEEKEISNFSIIAKPLPKFTTEREQNNFQKKPKVVYTIPKQKYLSREKKNLQYAPIYSTER